MSDRFGKSELVLEFTSIGSSPAHDPTNVRGYHDSSLDGRQTPQPFGLFAFAACRLLTAHFGRCLRRRFDRHNQMKKLLIAIWPAMLAPAVAYGDIFEFSEHGNGLSSTGKSEWLLLDDERSASADPYPWGITAICDGNGGFELSIALHGIVASRPKPVKIEYTIGDRAPVAARAFALDSILTGLSGSLEAELVEAIASGQSVLLSINGESGNWTTDFEGYEPGPNKVEFVSNGCR